GLLAAELRRLGLRTEVNLLDQNMEPEESLLRLSHERSAFFDLGVAIVSREGEVLWSLPATFLTIGQRVASEPWFKIVAAARDVEIVPATGSQLLYLVGPVVRDGEFSGAIVGGINLSAGRELDSEARGAAAAPSRTLVAQRTGHVIYPAAPPAWARDPVFAS